MLTRYSSTPLDKLGAGSFSCFAGERGLKVLLAAIFLLVLACGRAHAFWSDNYNGITSSCGGGHVSSGNGTFTPTIGGSPNSGDVIIFTVADTNLSGTIGISSQGTQTTQVIPMTGDDGSSDHNTSWNTSGKAGAFWVPYNSGDTLPTFSLGGTNSGTTTWTACAWAFVNTSSAIDVAASQANSSSLTISFPTITTAGIGRGEEILYYGIGNWGGSFSFMPYGSPPGDASDQSSTAVQNAYITTCGQHTGFFGPVTTQGASSPETALMEVNTGNCGAVTTGSSAAFTVGGSAGTNVAFVIALEPNAAAPLTVGVTSNPILNEAGSWALLPNTTGGIPWDINATSSKAVVGLTSNADNYVTQAGVEPYCYSTPMWIWDDEDNRLENAYILGKLYHMTLSDGAENRCQDSASPPGNFGTPLCSSTKYSSVSRTPNWFLSSNSCDGNSAVPYIYSSWESTSKGSPEGSINILFDIGSSGYLTAVKSYIDAAGTRYCNASGGACTRGWTNLVGETLPGMSRQSDEQEYNAGGDGTTTNCGGYSGATIADCQAIDNATDWPGASQSVSQGRLIIPTTNNNSATSKQPIILVATNSGTTASSEPNWVTQCGSSGGLGTHFTENSSITWMCKGLTQFDVQDSAQWGTVPAYATSTIYSLWQMVVDGNGNLEVALTPGMSGSSAPSWTTTVGNMTLDNISSTTSPGGIVWELLKTSFSGLGYTENSSSCTESGGTVCGELLHGQKQLTAEIGSEFPGLALMYRGYSSALFSGTSWSGSVTTACPNASTQDPLTNALQCWHLSTYPGKFIEQNNAGGASGVSTTAIQRTVNLDYGNQPLIGISMQPFGAQHNAGSGSTNGGCDGGSSTGLYSYNSTDCIPPMTTAWIASGYMAPNLCRIEQYLVDIDNSASLPWIQLCTDLARGL
jgi:hypothetical protein